MRRTIVLFVLSVTVVVMLSALVPFYVVIGETARDQAISDAQRQVMVVAPVLAGTSDPSTIAEAVAGTEAGRQQRMAVYLPDGRQVGHTRVGASEIRPAMAAGVTSSVQVTGGSVLVQPIGLHGGGIALAVVFVPAEVLTRGLRRWWLILAALGISLIVGSVLAADRLAARFVRAASGLAEASAALGAGDLSARVHPSGPPELVAAAKAFNTMTAQVRRLLATERELVADLYHRLRTPLTALRLNADALDDSPVAQRTRGAVERLEREADLIITSVSHQESVEVADCDVARLVRQRLEFWSALAEDQQRSWQLHGADAGTAGATRVPVRATQLAAAVDAVIGNVFRHTPETTAFVVSVMRDDGVVAVVVEDAGPGVAELSAAIRRGYSGAGSTGLGLDIARRVAESTGGGLSLDHSQLGGARISMWMRQ